MKNGADPRCPIYAEHEKTIDHLKSGYPILAPNEYLNRHNKHYGLFNNKILNVNVFYHKIARFLE